MKTSDMVLITLVGGIALLGVVKYNSGGKGFGSGAAGAKRWGSGGSGKK
jgi:hypothetical protein